MKRQIIYSICAVLLLAIAVVGSTYAFFSASAGENSNVTTEAKNFEVIYTGGTEINGPINLSVDRTGGINTTVHIKIGEGSAEALSYLYLNILEMTNNLSVSNVKWEISGVKEGKEVYTDNGTFQGYNATTNNKIPLVKNYRLTETQTDFTLYIWIDGPNTGNEILGANFSGYISANTERFTGQLSGV